MDSDESRQAERTERTVPVTLRDGETPDSETGVRPDVPSILVVEVVGGPLDGLRRRVESAVLTIGRSPSNDLVLSHDPMVSSRHARIVREGDRCWIEDLGSLNGSFRDTDRVQGRASLHWGSLVTVGRTRLEFLSI